MSATSTFPDKSRAKTRFGAADIALATLVIATVAMMIVPLPTWLLDLLIATNLSASVAILLVVLYAPDALSIATFPTVLLLTTLFRLALNVSSARLILLQANAGEVIHAFGNFVVRGNYVVGAVVFLILTIIQFVVIAKGSERVAEVGARFVLDAMPGKQMAIDAELRSGAIDGNEAKRRRRELSRESQFYGAMDGAMKFVKGDVIASLIITIINISGGLGIGMGQKGLTAVVALKRYGLLTIGDGLVSQIPALVLSTAAGVLVTRTASEEANTPLGAELSRQLLGTPKALQVAAVFVLLLAAVPGLPAFPFAILGGLLLIVARTRTKQMDKERSIRIHAGSRDRDRAFVPVVVPWSISIAPDLEPSRDDIQSEIEIIRQRVFSELGVPLPPSPVSIDEELPSRQVVLSLHEVPAKIFVVGQGDKAPSALSREVTPLLRARASDFLGLGETQRLLDELEQISPALVRNVIPKAISLPLLADVLRRLASEQVSVRDLRGILEALSLVAAQEKDPLNLAEFVRSHQRRAITYELTRGAPELEVYLLDGVIEDTIRRAITRTSGTAFLALPPSASRDLLAAIKRALSEVPKSTGPRIFLTQPDIRRFVRTLIEIEFPNTVVISFTELLPEISLRPIAKAHLGGIG